MAARRAIVRWAWRLFRREWRQQLLVLALIVVAVAATVVGATVAADSPAPSASGFGSAQYLAAFPGSDPHLARSLATLEHRFAPLDVIENESLTIPGTLETYQLRSQNPRGPYGQSMLALVSGHYPSGPGQVAVTAGVASAFNLRIGDVFHVGGKAFRVVGTVENPESLLDEFALVVPGQVPAPTQVTVLFDTHGERIGSLSNVQSRSSAPSGSTAFNPVTISAAAVTIGMLLIALMAVGGFTVLAQRRLRSLGMLASIGARPRDVGLVVRANGAVVGVAGAVLGVVVGLAVWLAYRPHLESSSHHLIGVFAVPWVVVALAAVLAVLATYLAASRPARSIARVPIVAALSGRPAPPRQIHRSAIPGIVCFAISFLLLGYAGGGSGAKPRAPELVLGLVVLIPGVVLLSPFFLSALARLGRRAPIAIRLALRDLARYRARSGSALGAISIGVLIAVVIVLVANVRYSNTLDYAGPNLASNQLIVWTPSGGNPGPSPSVPAGSAAAMDRSAHHIAASLGTGTIVQLDTTNANLDATGTPDGRNWNGALYVATPSLLRAFGITPSEVDPNADVLTMRPGIVGRSDMQLNWTIGETKQTTITPGSPPPSVAPGGQGSGGHSGRCTVKTGCLAHPVIQQLGALPSGTSAPNTVLTEGAVHRYGLQLSTAGWLIQADQPFTAAQLTSARLAAAAAGLSVETKNDQPTSAEVIDWATVFGIALALAILAMSLGLLRSETARDLRTLAATGASGPTRRTLTAATAGAMALLGAVLGTLGGYVGVIGYIRSNSLNGGLAALGSVPVKNLLVILIGMPLVAVAIGFVLAGREPRAIGHQPIE